jgi:hypothetical protein
LAFKCSDSAANPRWLHAGQGPVPSRLMYRRKVIWGQAEGDSLLERGGKPFACIEPNHRRLSLGPITNWLPRDNGTDRFEACDRWSSDIMMRTAIMSPIWMVAAKGVTHTLDCLPHTRKQHSRSALSPVVREVDGAVSSQTGTQPLMCGGLVRTKSEHTASGVRSVHFEVKQKLAKITLVTTLPNRQQSFVESNAIDSTLQRWINTLDYFRETSRSFGSTRQAWMRQCDRRWVTVTNTISYWKDQGNMYRNSWHKRKA